MKNLKDYHKLRLALLGIIFLGVIGVLGRSLLVPVPSESRKITPTAFTFPTSIEIPGWQPLTGYGVNQTEFSDMARDRLLANQIYQYQKRDRLLTIEMYYTIDTNGRATKFLDWYTDVPASLALSPQRLERYREGTGYYLLLNEQSQAYLISCINPRGESSIKLEQFQQNRYRYDLRIERLLRWFLYSESIRDFRCLWVKMSVPTDGAATEQDFSILENTWFFWYRWWQPQFPRP